MNTYKIKVMISVLFAGLWIYFRTDQCYVMIPRGQILPVLYVMLWTYLNYVEPLMLPVGLLILFLYGYTQT